MAPLDAPEAMSTFSYIHTKDRNLFLIRIVHLSLVFKYDVYAISFIQLLPSYIRPKQEPFTNV
jgi:hypothetical protein